MKLPLRFLSFLSGAIMRLKVIKMQKKNCWKYFFCGLFFGLGAKAVSQTIFSAVSNVNL